jgi:hypothetical protein
VLTVAGIAPDGALTTREGVSVPAEFRQWCHGYVVTSHKAQGWTADHVVVAAERFTAKSAYVACSRGREFCAVHTPDKDRLVERLPEGNRRAALDVLRQSPDSPTVLSRVEAWMRLTARAVRQIVRQIAGSPPIRQDRGIKI